MRGAWWCVAAAAILASATAAPAPWQARDPHAGLRQADLAAATAADTRREFQYDFNNLEYTKQAVAQGGSAYLDGLRRSLEQLLRPPACDRASTVSNRTNDTVESKEPDSAAISECQSRIRAAESVRGVAELALYTSKLLASEALEPRRERQLLATLAKLLHSLARTVGYRHEPPPSSPPTPDTVSERASYRAPTLPPHFMNATSEQVAQMIRCLDPRNTDPRPSHERCPTLASLLGNNATTDNSTASNGKGESDANRTRRDTRRVGDSNLAKSGRIDDTKTRPEDPHQDLSLYLKFKQGRTITDDQVGAAQTRLSLERIFNEPSIEMARRYGSNYRGNDVFNSGAVRIILDA